MKIKKPNSKILYFLILVTILVTTTIIFSTYQKNNTQQNPQNPQQQINLTIKNSLDKQFDPTDSDGDLLPDWQEAVWGTDKNNSDTDGDGTLDGEEVNQGRNPLVVGPDDKILTKEEIISSYKTQSDIDENSHTSILSKNLLLRIAQLEQNGNFSTEEGEKIAENLYNESLQLVNIPDKYPESLFLTFDSEEKEKLEKYYEEFKKIQLQEILKIDQNDNNLMPIIEGYKNTAEKMTSILVPKILLKTHAKITNNYYLVAESLINLNNSDKDPLLGLLSIPIYQKISLEQPILFKQVEIYLQNNDIINKSQN